ncbi:hypothetical protein PFWH6_0773 [Pseudomonas fluorescens WH6]|nr:hypothetical protein PFWH6_0773 [Pseudomonas fluorescens WH6]
MHGFGGALWLSAYRESSAKVIVIRPLRTPATGEGLAYFFQALRGVEHPGARLPGRLVAQVLGMTARQLGYPMKVVVLMEAGDRRDRWSVPFVRVLFAFGQILV